MDSLTLLHSLFLSHTHNSHAVKCRVSPSHAIHKLLTDSDFSHEFTLTHIDAHIPNEVKNKCCYPFHKSQWHKGKIVFTAREIIVWCLLVELVDHFLGSVMHAGSPARVFGRLLTKQSVLTERAPTFKDLLRLLAPIAGTLILLMLLSASSVTTSQDVKTLNPPPSSAISMSHFLTDFCSPSPFSHAETI